MKNNLPLTKKEENVLQFIEDFMDNNGYAPTNLEISERFNFIRQTAGYYIRKLKDKGFIKSKKGWRNIKIIYR